VRTDVMTNQDYLANPIMVLTPIPVPVRNHPAPALAGAAAGRSPGGCSRVLPGGGWCLYRTGRAARDLADVVADAAMVSPPVPCIRCPVRSPPRIRVPLTA